MSALHMNMQQTDHLVTAEFKIQNMSLRSSFVENVNIWTQIFHNISSASNL